MSLMGKLVLGVYKNEREKEEKKEKKKGKREKQTRRKSASCRLQLLLL